MNLKKTAAIVGGTTGVSYLTYQAISEHMFKRAFKQKKHDIPVEVKYQEWLDASNVEKLDITSFDGLKLTALDIHNHDNENYIIMLHGIWADKRYHYPRAYEFDQLGYNLFLIDQRASGESEGKYYTYGFKESLDLTQWIDLLLRRHPQAQICLYGVSMGAATIMMSTRNHLPSNIRCIVEDCGFSSVEEQFDNVLRQDYNVLFTKVILKMLEDKMSSQFGMHYDDLNIKEILDENEIPIMFIHGKKDTFVPFEMSLRLYNHNKGPKKYYPVEGAKHCEAIKDETYYQNIHEFISEYFD